MTSRRGPGRRPAVGATLLAGAALLAALPAVGAEAPGIARSLPGAGPDPVTRAAPASRTDRFLVPGETSRYRVAVALGPRGAAGTVGTARLAVEGREEVEGRETTRVSLEMEARVPLVYRMHSRRTSWIARDPFRSLRFEEHLREGDYRRHRRYRLHQDRGVYTRYDRAGGASSPRSGEPRWRAVPGETDVPMPGAALDEVSFLYFLRTLPLEVGETYRFDRLFEADGNPVVLEVLRRESIRVPAGRFETVVVRPVIRSSGLFSEGGEAEVYLTDDRRRLIVRVDSRMKVGRLHLYLEEHRPGAPDRGSGEAP